MSKGTRFHINPFLNELLLYLVIVTCHGAYHPIHWFWSHIIIFEGKDEVEEPYIYSYKTTRVVRLTTTNFHTLIKDVQFDERNILRPITTR